MLFDPSLYLVTDPTLCAKRGMVESVREAMAGGVTLVQLRDKVSSPFQVAEMARALLSELRPANIPLIINDYPEMVRVVGAQGVHIGHADLDPRQAREILPPGAILGVSVEKSRTISPAALEVADYLAASPVFSTQTKTDCEEPFELDGLKALRAQTQLPLVAIGGISAGNVQDVFEAGADGVAVISAILGADDIRAAAKILSKAISDWRRRAKV